MYSESRKHLLYGNQINKSARPELARILDKHGGPAFLIKGKLSRSKAEDYDELVVLIDEAYRYLLISDMPAVKNEGLSEKFHKTVIDTRGTEILETIIMERAGEHKRRESTGRPIKFGDDIKERAKELREQGLSIRKIAAELNVSPTTVYNRLKGVH